MKSIVIFLSLVLAASANAGGHFIHAHYVQAHLDSYAYGKKVRAVSAHAGISVRDGGTPRTFWLTEKTVPLHQRGDHFWNKFLLLGKHNSAYGEARFVIQYFIWFHDGSSMITPVYSMNPRSAHHQSTYNGCGEFSSETRALSVAPEAYRQATDGLKTVSDYRSCSHI